MFEIVLAKPIEELIPKSIDWNNEKLLSEVRNEIAANFEGRIYTDDVIAEAKDDRAKLNAFTKNLNAMRINVKKEYEEPYERFKAQVDEVLAVVQKAADSIDEQIKAYDEKQKADKLAEIKKIYDEQIGDLKDYVPFEKLFNEKWLNKTSTLAAIKHNIESIINDIVQALSAIHGLKSENESQLTALYFRTLNLSEAIAENERLKAEKLKAEQLKAKTAEVPFLETNQKKEVIEVIREEVKPRKIYNIRFEVQGDIEQLRKLKEFFMLNNIIYTKI